MTTCVFCGRTDDLLHFTPGETWRERVARILLGVRPTRLVVCQGRKRRWPLDIVWDEIA